MAGSLTSVNDPQRKDGAPSIMQTDELQARLAAIVATSDDAIVSKNLDGVVLSWNAAAERIFGYTADEIIGQPILILLPPERLDEEATILAKIRRGERVDHFETVRVRKDGRRIDVSVTISPIHDAAGNVIGASKIARDISEYKQLIKEREQLLSAERAARSEAERMGRMKDEFLATLSHELRTPLNAILGWSQLLQHDTPDAGDASGRPRGHRAQRPRPDPAHRRPARHEPHHLRQASPRRSAVDLASVIGAAIDSVRPSAELKQIRLQKMLDPVAGPVSGDPNRLQQIVWNLLTNAIKFTPKGGRVEVLLERVNSHVEITVSDTGQGISPIPPPRLRPLPPGRRLHHPPPRRPRPGPRDRQTTRRAPRRTHRRQKPRRRPRRDLHRNPAARRHPPRRPNDANIRAAPTANPRSISSESLSKAPRSSWSTMSPTPAT